MKKVRGLTFLWVSWAIFASAQFIKWGPDKTVQLTVTHPPQFGLTVKRVAFGQPGGGCANDAGELTDRMILPDFQQHQMDVIERQALDQIMAEHNLNQSGYVDPGSAARLGKILGPSALIIVSVNNCSSERLPLYNDQKNLNGGITRTFISKTRFSLEGSVRVVDLTTGQILGSHNFESKPEKTNEAQNGQPEFPEDEVKDDALQAVRFQVDAMFFPSGDPVNLIFYDDKDCNLNQVYQTNKNGDREGALQMMDANLESCKAGKHKDKSLARAYYDDGVLHCLHADYDKAALLFTSAMDAKGADAVAQASSACERAKAGAASLKAYEARVAQIEAPPPINTAKDTAQEAPAPSKPPRTGAPAPVATPSSLSAEERLKKLDSLYKRGIITKKEYDEKRAEILKDL